MPVCCFYGYNRDLSRSLLYLRRFSPPCLSALLCNLSMMCLLLLLTINQVYISGCLQPTQLSWLPVLSNVAPPSLRRKAATNVLHIIEADPNWSVYANVFLASTSTACISTPNMTFCPSTKLHSGERTGRRFMCSTTHYCNRPYYSSAMVSISLVIHVLCWTVSGHVKANMSCKHAQMGSHPITFLWLSPASDHEPCTLSTRAH